MARSGYVLGVVAGAALMATPSAAADLGRGAPAAVDYVRVCGLHGEGFFYIPGSDTCLRIGGTVRAQYVVGDETSFDTGSGHIPYHGGLSHLRDYNSLSTLGRVTLSLDARSGTEYGILRSYGEFSVTSQTGSATTKLEKAFLQFGQLTAGHTTSMWDFYTGSALGFNFGDEIHDETTNLLAWTFDLGNGLSSTWSLEDSTAAGRYDFDGIYGGNKWPDLIGNVNLTRPWGAAQVMVALHDTTGSTDTGAGVGAGLGYAVGAGVMLNVAHGGLTDQFGLQAAYGRGALMYVSTALQSAVPSEATDFFEGEKSQAWGGEIGYTHHFSPEWSAAIEAAYIRYRDADSSTFDLTQWDLAASLTWAPVRNLDVTLGAGYRSTRFDTFQDGDGWSAGLRMERRF